MGRATCLALLLLGAGCAQNGFDDAAELADEIGCIDVERGDVDGGTEVVCVYDGEPLTLLVFDDSDRMSRYVDRRSARLQPTVHGDNWVVSGPAGVLDDVHEEVGGTFTGEDM